MLLVFLMSSSIAIMLYMQLPRAAFEAQRAKEELLQERGEQYIRAIQLYVAKWRSYPPSMDSLEKANGIRYLRKRYKDPMTGKDEWRLIHVNAAGQLVDSLIKKKEDEKKPNLNNFISEAPTIGSTGTNTEAAKMPRCAAVQVTRLRLQERPGSILRSILRLSAMERRSRTRRLRQTGRSRNLVSHRQVNRIQPGQPGQPFQPNQLPRAAAVRSTTSRSQLGQPQQAANTGIPYPGSPCSRRRRLRSPAEQAAPQPGQHDPVRPGQPGQPGTPNQGIDMINKILTTPRSQMNMAVPGAPGLQIGGGIAGVASVFEGPSIKVYNEREKYQEWEFVYDMKKDKRLLGAAAGVANQQNHNPLGNNQNPQQVPNNGGIL